MSSLIRDKLATLRGKRRSVTISKQVSENDLSMYATIRKKKERTLVTAASFKENTTQNLPSSPSGKPLPNTPGECASSPRTKKPLPPPPCAPKEDSATTSPKPARTALSPKDCRSPHYSRRSLNVTVSLADLESASPPAGRKRASLLNDNDSLAPSRKKRLSIAGETEGVSASKRLSTLNEDAEPNVASPVSNKRLPILGDSDSTSPNSKRSSLTGEGESVTSPTRKRPSIGVKYPTSSPKKQRLSKQAEKDRISQDVEEILRFISAHQRALLPQLGIQQDDALFREIRTDVKILAKAFQCFANPNAKDESDGIIALTSKESIETTLFHIAKQLIQIKSIVEKTESNTRLEALGNFVNYVKKYMTTGELPSEVPHIPIELAISLINYNLNTDEVYNTLKDTQYKRGFLKKQGRALKGMHKRWVVLTHEQLIMYHSEKQEAIHKKSTPVSKISAIHCYQHKDGHHFHFVLSLPYKKVTLHCETVWELAEWVLAIDGVSFYVGKLVVDEEPAENLVALTKESLLNLLYKKPFQGGTIISTANDEEWVFSSNGVLTNKAWGDALEYIWDGATLQPSPRSQMSLGIGKWNGVWLAWYGEHRMDPFLRYFYSRSERKYIVSYGHPDLTWRFVTSTSLVSAAGNDKWTCDGDVPHPVVMLLQVLRYYRVGR